MGMKKKKQKNGFEHIGSIIDDVIKAYGNKNDPLIGGVWRVWEHAVGETIANHARPAAVKGKLLLVYVTNSTWLHQLQFLKADILAKLNAALDKPLVEEIKFKIGSIGK